jgi:hypothetical protein
MYPLFVFLCIEGISTLILMESNSPPFLLHGIRQKNKQAGGTGVPPASATKALPS